MTENNNYNQQESRVSVWAVISLISGIVNFVAAPFFGALGALISGYIGKNEIDKSGGMIEGDRLATAGIVLGWIGIALSILQLCLIALVTLGIIAGGIIATGPISDWLQNLPRY